MLDSEKKKIYQKIDFKEQGTHALLLDYQDVCLMLKIGKNAFYNLKATGRFPVPAIHLGGRVRYSRRHVENWIESGCSVHWRAER